MEEVLMESHGPPLDKAGSLVLDIENLTQTSESCSPSPKVMKTLSRKGSSRIDRRNVEEQDIDGATKKVVGKGIPPMANISNLSADMGDGRMRKFNHFMTINPKKILLLFASMSSLGTIILIYFTLVIYFKGV
ncbi:uncharacterized protein LOC121967635 isoform X2 [Zingiber officinale]|uniref:uncharacterized protein LOC121967632 isoform X2 n=1 Tax=Zingiber officinale TaxID=94328 RepID=UPI001C4C308B|nr:uncharacterized protein LOC121967632 isoform X2 [Zingiber officinale]XP_042373919.1 uncharacterized protein LOC121967635 isoform X2 [Zingiber officinale]